jgi:hypothetical protein
MKIRSVSSRHSPISNCFPAGESRARRPPIGCGKSHKGCVACAKMWFACAETCDGGEPDPAGSNDLPRLRGWRLLSPRSSLTFPTHSPPFQAEGWVGWYLCSLALGARHSGESRNPALAPGLEAQSFHSPFGRASYFSMCGQREVTKRKATPSSALSGHPATAPCVALPPASMPSPALRLREGATGFVERTSVCAQRTGAHPARHPAGFSFAPSPRHRGPFRAASCRRSKSSHFLGSVRAVPAPFAEAGLWRSCHSRSTRAMMCASTNCPSRNA